MLYTQTKITQQTQTNLYNNLLAIKKADRSSFGRFFLFGIKTRSMILSWLSVYGYMIYEITNKYCACAYSSTSFTYF